MAQHGTTPVSFLFQPHLFEELFISLALGQQDHPMPDFTKLNKAMYLVDFATYREEGHPITGADYLHYDEGPVPMQLADCYPQLVLQDHIEPRRRRHPLGDFVYPHVPSRLPNRDLLSPRHRDLIQQVLEILRHRTPAEATDLLRNDPGWSTTTGQRIPYENSLHNSHVPHAFRDQAAGLAYFANPHRQP